MSASYEAVVTFYTDLQDQRWSVDRDLALTDRHQFSVRDATGVYGVANLTVYRAFAPVRFTVVFLPASAVPSGSAAPVPAVSLPAAQVAVPSELPTALVPPDAAVLGTASQGSVVAVQFRSTASLEALDAFYASALKSLGANDARRYEDSSGVAYVWRPDAGGGELALQPMADGTIRVSVAVAR